MTGVTWSARAPSLLRPALLAVLPTLCMVLVRTLGGVDPDGRAAVWVWLSAFLALLVGRYCRPRVDGARFGLGVAAVVIPVVMLIAGLLYSELGGRVMSVMQHYASVDRTHLAWVALAGFFGLLLAWLAAISDGLSRWRRLPVELLFAAAAGLVPALHSQVETRYSTEEFFVVVEAALLVVFWLMLRAVFVLAWQGADDRDTRIRWSVPVRGVAAVLGVAVGAGIVFTIYAYQQSFFPAEAPEFAGVTEQSPYLCGMSAGSADVYPGEQVFENMLRQVEASEIKAAPEYALLALGSGDHGWAETFRATILQEAAEGQFTTPTGSIKYGQYLASQRAYFYPLVRDAFPTLFSHADQTVIEAWFADVNERALTVEWVDWMYALAFRYWPEGPYENQETGAGLLSLLEVNGLADARLSTRNRTYLVTRPRGWSSAFRVTDDAAQYQPEWIENAWYQSMFSGNAPPENVQRSFDWMKALAPADGTPLQYNHIGNIEYGYRAYWGATLLDDEELLWLAGRALESGDAAPAWFRGQPGAEVRATFDGRSPSLGSCLLFGGSGLPTRAGPLGPDKVVMRGGWEPLDPYVSVNLRFTGWHRYRATNALMQVYAGEPLVVEDTLSEPSRWLPAGRSLFRDKRIPRQNLNGLQIHKSGLASVLFLLTGVGSDWAQDPPFFAEVARFETTPTYDLSSTVLEGWGGWRHRRAVYMHREGGSAGFVAVLDDAQGPTGKPVALSWHLVGDAPNAAGRAMLGSGQYGGAEVTGDAEDGGDGGDAGDGGDGDDGDDGRRPGVQRTGKGAAEVVMLPIDGEPVTATPAQYAEGLSGYRVQYEAPNGRRLRSATLFLLGHWVGAGATATDEAVVVGEGADQVVIRFADVFRED